ncbi:MAG: hypothetical protein ACHQFW_10640, partial [Chitinophagales bacterium]
TEGFLIIINAKYNRSYHRLLLAIILGAFVSAGFISKEGIETSIFCIPALSDQPPQGNFEKLVIPLKRVNNLFLIEARIDTVKGNFIFDTGAPKLVLNKTYFRSGKLLAGTSSYGISGGGEQVLHQNIDSLIIDDLFFTGVDADVVNLGHIENAKGVKILGLLGANLFTGMEMEIDIEHGTLTVYKINMEGNRLYADDTTSAVADINMEIEVDNNIIFLEASVAEKKLRFCLDTGAEINVLSNTVNNKVLNHFSLTNRTSLGGSGSQSVNVLNGKLDMLIIETDTLREMPFVLTGLSHLQMVYNTNIDGILGYQFLAKGRVVINVEKRNLLMYFYKEENE